MGKLTELEQWDEDVYQIETSDPVLGGPEGVSNRPQKQLANRTQWLKKRLEDANNALAEHEKSRNHPDATLTDKGFVKLYSGVTSMDETAAATPKAVKIAMDNANARLAKERNLADLTNIPLARQSLQLGNSATRNTGTTAGTVAAGDDARILATKKAVDDTQIGLAAQGVMWITSADDLSNLPSGARRFASNKAPATVLPAAGYFFIEVLAKRDTANGSCILATSDKRDVWIGTRYTVPDEAGFTWIQLNQNVENLGLKETLNPTKRVSIGNIGTGAFDGSTPSINIGDSDSGFIGSADGVLDIYCNNAKVGYIDNAGLHMLADILSTGAIRAGGSKKLAIQSDNNSTLSAIFNLRGDANRPTVIELNDDQGWHLYSQRNIDGSIRFTVNGDVTAGRALHAGNATFAADGNVNGSVWGGWLNDWINNNFNRKNTAGLGSFGWVRDESTGFIMQWGTLGGSNGTYNFPRAFPAACFAVFVTNTSSQGALVDNAFGYPVNNSQFFAATKASNGAGTGAYPVAWFAIGR